MVLAEESVFILEVTPAAYLALACNEALKAARVKLITIRPFGATGRLVLSGPRRRSTPRRTRRSRASPL